MTSLTLASGIISHITVKPITFFAAFTICSSDFSPALLARTYEIRCDG